MNYKKEWVTFAASLLEQFVKNVEPLYSKDFMIYNMHSLLHLSEDALIHGPLDRFSAFEFESYMQVLKRMLRAIHDHLSQVIFRDLELQHSNIISNVNYSKAEC